MGKCVHVHAWKDFPEMGSRLSTVHELSTPMLMTSAAPNLGTLVARDLAAYREAVAIAAAFPIEINDARALRKQLRFFGPDESIPELEPACLVSMAQALEDVRTERRARNVAVARASARSQFWRQRSGKRRGAGGDS